MRFGSLEHIKGGRKTPAWAWWLVAALLLLPFAWWAAVLLSERGF